jgi:enoyl-[acyl-carrier protein] reductase I
MIRGKKGIVIGIANDHSIAWGIAKQLHASGAELAITYQNNTLLKRVKPLADKVNSDTLVECDVNNEDHLQNTLTQIKKKFGTIDFIIHAVAYSDKNELNGRYIDTSKDNFINSLSISCYSFTRIAKIFQPIINPGGSLVTLSFHGANKVMPNYNVMGVAKAALETSVKYLSVDLGDQNIRVNAISAGPMRTLAGAAIANARDVFNYTSENSSLKRNVNLDELGNSALYLVSDLSSAITGEIHYVDCGFNIVGMPKS